MCDCKTLTSKWWARPNFDSDHEAAERGWQQVSRVSSGWAVLWRCPACGRHWQGIVACSRSSQDGIEYWRKGKPKQGLLLTLARNGVQEAK